jgi:integrase
MSRSYKRVRPNSKYVYAVNDLMSLYECSRNTVTAWVKEGMKPSDDKKPYVFNGAEVIRFHKERQERTKKQLRFGEFKCLHCKTATFPDISTIAFQVSGSKNSMISAQCFDCKEQVTKIHSEADCNRIRRCLNTNTSLGPADEEIARIPSGVGKDQGSFSGPTFTINDRTIFHWLINAGGSASKTIDAHLRSIRVFEEFHKGKLFEKLTPSDVAQFRDHLKTLASADDETRLNISTIKHRASHLKLFFEWLLKQPNAKKLNKALPIHLNLPKKFHPNDNERDETWSVPTIGQVTETLEELPTTTLLQRRNRAMIAVAFLGALRVGTTTTLMVKHLDIANQQIIQSGVESDTKNGKSLIINWFPVPPLFSTVAREWLSELKVLGFREDDPLFPSNTDLKKPPKDGHSRVDPMKTISAIETAFKTACMLIGQKFNPHMAKQCIGQMKYDLCKDARERKAWSLNMGHKSEAVTDFYYGDVPANDRRAIFRDFLNIRPNTPEDMELMLRYHEHFLTKGTPEYARAETLVNNRRKQKQDRNDDDVITD